MSDTGPGVPQKAREHLFEAFQTSGRPGGSGLGLAIAAELVRAHGGDIHLVEGTIGATFRIAIPDRPVELLSVRNERAQGVTASPPVIPGRCQRVRPPAGPMTGSASNPESRGNCMRYFPRFALPRAPE